MPSYDVVVAGLGGFGSAAAAHLARRGARVLGLDPRPGAHAEGSSHGETRIVRQVYFEGATYVPLLRRAYELWAELDDSDGPLLQITGGLFLGGADTRVFRGSLDTARHWGLDHEVLDAAELRSRFPALCPPADVLGLYESQAGTVPPERAVAAQLRRATKAGAELRHDEPVVDWSVTSDGVRVRTARSTYDGGALVLCPGKWAPEIVRLDLPLRVERRVQRWFAPPDIADFRPGRLPVWIWDRPEGTSFYGAPSQDGRSVKAAVHFSTSRDADSWTTAELAGALGEIFPKLGSRQVREAECWYTITPDEHFVVGPHPEAPRVLLACGFSGHGFKFTPVLGEVLAELALDGSTSFDLSAFSPQRFG